MPKYVQALDWYNKGAYFKAIPVFEELMGLYKGSQTTEEIYYYYCMAQFKQGNYILSAYHFKNYVQQHPFSQYTEECLYMYAESYDKQSPKSHLDQTETYNAIEAYQVFINQYPETERLDYCNKKIDELQVEIRNQSFESGGIVLQNRKL
jgi:outer membrane protein assembly factor BamD